MQDIANSRMGRQREEMEKLAKSGECLFCPGGLRLLKKPIHFTGKYWYVAPNDFPYEGTTLHLVVAPHRHITSPEELTAEELGELFSEITPRLRREFGLDGCSALFRFGNTRRTGATIHHLHIHFIQGAERQSQDHEPIWAVVGFKQ